jgi:hypothetical protein
MSANYLIDHANTSLFVPSISVAPSSGSLGTVGLWCDLSNSDSFCNVFIAVGAVSGPIIFDIQTAQGPNDIPLGNSAFSGNIFSGGAPASGSFTDPTSGLAQLPTWFSSGGQLIVNSGLWALPGSLGQSGPNVQVNGYPQGTLPYGPNPIQHGQGGFGVTSGTAPIFCSGGTAYAAFQRNYQYARIVVLSGSTIPPFVQAGFVAQLMTTGSGGGASQQPFTPFLVNV